MASDLIVPIKIEANKFIEVFSKSDRFVEILATTVFETDEIREIQLSQPYVFYLHEELLPNFLKSKADFRESKITSLLS